jgi:PAS domain S-box-containing protein
LSFIAAVVVLNALSIQGARESSVLVATLNTLFLTAAGLLTAYLAARTYLVTRSRAVLSFGAGALLLGLASLIAGLLIGKPNEAITVHNTGFASAGVAFSLCAYWLLYPERSRTAARTGRRTLTLCFLGVVVYMALLTMSAVLGFTHKFYIVGQGGTTLRQVILGLAVFGFLGASGGFGNLFRRSRTRFILFCCAGLAMIGVGLGTVLVGGAVGSPLVWLGRSGQYLGGLYLIIAVAGAGRARGPWLLPLERALRETEDRYQALVEFSPDAIVVTTEGKYVFANASAARLLGAESPQELLGKEAIQRIHPDDRDLVTRRMAQVQTDSLTRPHEIKVLRLDGIAVDVEAAGVRIEFDGTPANQVVLRDITERKRAERELQIASHGIENASVGVLRLDSEGRIREANGYLCRLLGYSRQELLEMMIFEVSVGMEARAWPERWKELKGLGPVTFAKDLRTKSGGIIPVEVSSSIVEFDGEDYDHGFIRDITERKRAEEALRQSEEQLRQSQKMEAVGQLAGGIAHDFNNLLTAIIGYSDILLASGASSLAAARPDIEEIRLAAERAASLTKQILAFSRRQTLRPMAVSLNDILTGMEPLLRRTLGEDVDLFILTDPGLDHVEVDIHQFEQVIMNLAINARDAMASGGRLTLETVNVELDEEYCLNHPGSTPGRQVLLSVSDTGAGMDDVTRARVFEPFFTTKAPGEGTGLGLATVYGTVKQSHGSIFVRSGPGQGTTFKVYLPRVTAPARAEDPAKGTGLLRGNETILVVEDEAPIRSHYRRSGISRVGCRLGRGSSAGRERSRRPLRSPSYRPHPARGHARHRPSSCFA